MDLMRYIEEMQAYKEAYADYPPTLEEHLREQRREALRREIEEAELDPEPTLHPPIPRTGRRKYWK